MHLLWRLLAGLLALALIVVAGVAIKALIDREPPETAPLDPHPHSSFRIVALGDSYIAGQGTRRYYAGTDEPGRNMCHRSARAYPHLLADRLKASLVFVACSGAETGEVIDHDQYPASGEEDYGEVYGGRPQIEVLEEAEDFDVVLISIGGNDAGFAQIGEGCLRHSHCGGEKKRDSWLQGLKSEVAPDLQMTFTRVKEAAEGAPVFAMTYPIPLGREHCDELVGIHADEWDFLNVFVRELNKTVRRAARAAEIKWIALDRALVERRFCETERVREAAVNFIRVRVGSGHRIIHLGDIQESLHPNRDGHKLMEEKVLPRLQALRAEAEAGS